MKEKIIIENISGKRVREMFDLDEIKVLDNYKIVIEKIDDSLEPIKIKRGKIKKC